MCVALKTLTLTQILNKSNLISTEDRRRRLILKKLKRSKVTGQTQHHTDATFLWGRWHGSAVQLLFPPAGSTRGAGPRAFPTPMLRRTVTRHLPIRRAGPRRVDTLQVTRKPRPKPSQVALKLATANNISHGERRPGRLGGDLSARRGGHWDAGIRVITVQVLQLSAVRVHARCRTRARMHDRR